ncbi:MAG: BTAD domain-containing putative transcriptional regulator [Umezawaea sp.]
MGAEFRVLGPLEVLFDGRPVPLPLGRARALLATLLLRANVAVPVDELVDRLWGGSPPNPARTKATLQMVVTRLRQALGAANCVRTSAEGYFAQLDPEMLDLYRFRVLVASGDFVDALALWRGHPLSNVSSDSLHREEVPFLLDEQLEVLERRVEADLDANRLTGLVAELRSLTRRHPLRERFWAQLMLALYRSDQQAEALATYRAVKELLTDELGVDPGLKLRELHQRILVGTDDLYPPAAGRPAVPVPRQLPPDLAQFSGRGEELALLDRLIPVDGLTGRTVVVSAIAGAGGIGKTTLAVHWAHQVKARFPDGQLFVNLRGYDTEPPLSSGQALDQLLTALDVAPSRKSGSVDERAALYRSLTADRRMLVVLDNAATAEQVRPLLPASGTCCVIVTSRSELRGLMTSNDIRIVRLDVLGVEDSRNLLGHILHETEVDDETVDELAKLCGYLPLALRIAAANLVGRPRSSVERYLVALRDGDRLGQLAIEGDGRTAVRRTFQLSYQALADEPRRMFRLLGLAGGTDFSGPAAASLAGVPHTEAERLLQHLLDVHLVEQRHPGRYSFHDLLRLHAKERVAEEESDSTRDEALRRLIDFYLHSADQADRVIRPSRTEVVLPELSPGVWPLRFADYDAAVQWCASERINVVAATGAAFGQGLLVHAWQLPTVSWGYFSLRVNLVEWENVTRIALKAARALGDDYAEAACLFTLAGQFKARELYPEALELFEAALAIRQRIGHQHGIAVTHDGIGSTMSCMGRADEGVEHHKRSVAQHELNGNKAGRAISLNNLAFTLTKNGEFEAALDLCAEAIEVCERLRMHPTLASMKNTMVTILLGLHRYDDALRICDEVLSMPAEQRDTRTEISLLLDAGDASKWVGDIDGAQRLWREAQEVAERDGDPRVAVAWANLTALGGWEPAVGSRAPGRRRAEGG